MGLHVGVLGSGGWCRVHLAALAASPHVERVTLAARNAAAAAQLAAEFPIVARTFGDRQPLLDDPTIDVIDVVLPHHLHAESTQAALAAGKHVICEKPAATSLAEFDAVTAMAASAGRRVLVVMNQLYNPVHRRLRELVDAGAVGRPFLSVENSFREAGANYRRLDYWRNSPELAGGGVLIDGGYHMVYRHFDTLAGQGNPAWVLADTPQLAVHADGSPEPAKGEDFVSLVVGYDAPLRIQWAHAWTLSATPRRSRQSFLAGSEGTLEMTDNPAEPILLHRPDGGAAYGGRVVEVPAGPFTGTETTHACLLDYLDCLATGREPDHASLALARLTLATILAGYASGRSGRREGLGLD